MYAAGATVRRVPNRRRHLHNHPQTRLFPSRIVDAAYTTTRHRHACENDETLAEARVSYWLGCLDSNQEWLNQNQLCCQLHHIPIGMFITVVVNFVPPTGFEPVLAP